MVNSPLIRRINQIPVKTAASFVFLFRYRKFDSKIYFEKLRT